MTKEEKELLLKDLCARLPYKLWIHFEYESNLTTIDEDRFLDFEDVETLKYIIENPESDGYAKISWKPYLRPMSSMTEEEEKEFVHYASIEHNYYIKTNNHWYTHYQMIDWLNSHHFDYRGLIEKELAIAVTKENNPYKL